MSADDGLSRRDRKKLETQQRFEEQLAEMQAAARDVHKGESPFSVTMEQDAVAEGSRNISFNKVSVSVNGKALFKDTQVKLSAGCRYGLMGPNGRGKSTLLRLLVTRELPVQKSLHMMLVEQEQELEGGDLSAVDAVLQSHKIQKAYEDEAAVLRDVAELTSEQLERLNFLENELNIMGAQQSDAKARRILYGLGFPTDWHDRPTSSFSGGWRKRIALACAVFIEPDVLMLDEPTNHLDLNAVIWLESYLGQQYSETARRPKTLIVVSHDAGFLDEVCTHIVHIENFKIRYYRGGYSQFETQLEQAHAEADKKNEQIMKKISEQKRQGKSKVQVAEWLKEQCRLGKVDEEFVQRRTEYSVTFPFSQPPELRDACIIKLEDVAFNYPNGPELFRGVSCALWSDSRITLCGPNGIGKSTLLNLMTGDLEPTEGHVQLNRQVRIGRYTQHFIDKLPLERTPVEFLVSLGMKPEDGRAQLGCFGLEGVCHGQICASLSGGQKARVALAALTLPKPHFLLFDEPTNHLDLESIEALCDAINGFAGGVLVVTHDARLIERTNMQLWIAGNKTVVPFRGDLNDYKAMIRRDFLREEAAREEERLEKQRSKMEAKQHGGVEAAAAAKEAAAAVEKVKLAEEADALFAELDKKKKKKKKE